MQPSWLQGFWMCGIGVVTEREGWWMLLVRHPDAHSISQEMRVLVRRNAAALGRVGGVSAAGQSG